MAEESALQRKVIRDLKSSGWFVVKMVTTNVPGIPDTWIGRDSRCAWIEFKARGKKLEPLQAHRHSELVQHGFPVFVVDSWERYQEIKQYNL